MYLQLSKFLKNLALKFRQKSIYFELKHYIKKKETYFKSIEYHDRGIGKTMTLIQLAQKYKCPIVVPNNSWLWNIKNRVHRMGNKEIEIINANQRGVLGKRYDLILCEEKIDYEFIQELLKRCKCVVGFQNMSYDREDNVKKFEKEYACEWIGNSEFKKGINGEK